MIFIPSPNVAEDHQFKNAMAVVKNEGALLVEEKNIDDLKKILELKLQTKSTSEWCKIFEENKIPCGPINNIKNAVESPQIAERNMIVSANHNKIGNFKMAGNPIKMSPYEDPSTRGEIPDLDQHRKKILDEFN